MAADGTIGLEIVEDLPDVDVVLVPWGGGGLSIGIAAAIRAVKPSCRVFAVEVDGAAPLAPSLAAGRPVVVDYRPSFVDGIGSKTVFQNMFDLAREYLARNLAATGDVLVASPSEIAAAAQIVISNEPGTDPITGASNTAPTVSIEITAPARIPLLGLAGIAPVVTLTIDGSASART